MFRRPANGIPHQEVRELVYDLGQVLERVIKLLAVRRVGKSEGWLGRSSDRIRGKRSWNLRDRKKQNPVPPSYLQRRPCLAYLLERPSFDCRAQVR